VNEMMAAARQKLKDRCGDSTRLGGKGTARRKKRAPHKSAGGDDKKLQTVLKRLGLSNIPGIEEVAMFNQNRTVLHFTQPKVQASPGANTYVVTGHVEQRAFEQVMSPVIDPSKMNPELFKRIQAELAAGNLSPAGGDGQPRAAGAAVGGRGPAAASTEAKISEEDEVPVLVDNFDDVALSK